MTKNTKLGAVALIVGLALTLGACGSKGGTTGPTSSTDTAQVTFQSDPAAEIWVDGKASGSTPTVLSLTAGTHEVALKRQGFQELVDTITVAGGKPITVGGTLPVAGSDAAALRRLTAMLGEKHEAYAKPSTHRGGGEAVTLYYPMGDVRRAGLATYRVEVDPSYDYEGYIEFRKGTKVLHREKFEPEGMITEKALPAEVLEASRNGTTLTWGLAYDNKRRKRDQKLVKFKVIPKSREKKFAKKLAKTTSHKNYKLASPLLQEMAEIEELKRYRLYSEVLVRSLAVLNGWEETMMPYANMVDVMTRLKLKESGLYRFASSQVSGAGGQRLLKGGQGAVTDKTRNKTKGSGETGGLGRAASGTAQLKSTLPQVAVAPPSKRAGKTGMKAGGLGVKPTDNGSKAGTDSAGSIPGSTAGGEQPSNHLFVQRKDLDRQLEELKEKLREADLRAANEAEARENLDNIQSEIEGMGETIADAEKAAADAQSAVADAEQKLKDLESSGTASDSDLEAAQAAAQAAREAAAQASNGAEEAKQRVQTLEQERKNAESQMRRDAKKAGDTGDAAQEAEKLRKEVSQVEQQIQQADKQLNKGGGQDPTTAGGEQSSNPLLTRSSDLDRHLAGLKAKLREADLSAANEAASRENLDNLQTQIESMGETIADAEKAAADAQGAVADAEQKLKDLETSGTATDSELEAAQAAAQAAREAAAQASNGAEEAKQRVEDLEQERKNAESQMRRDAKKAGDTGDAAQEAEKLRKEVSQVEQQIQQADKQRSKVGGQDPAGAGTAPGTGTSGQPGYSRSGLDIALKQAQSDLKAAQGVLDAATTDRGTATTEVESTRSERDAAQQAFDAIANGTLPAAEQELDAKTAALDALVTANAPKSQIDAATDAVKAAAANLESTRSEFEEAEAEHNAAEANAARAEMELTRLEAAAIRAEQDKNQAAKEIQKLNK